MDANDKRPTHLDLFSGIGGFALAAGRAGFRTVGFAETDAYASAVLAKHWPGVRNYGDVRGLAKGRNPLTLALSPGGGEGGRIDLLTAGVPCQPASCAGKRRGAADDRWLWDAALAVTERFRPVVAVYENPPGIISVELGGYAFGVEDLDGAIAFGDASGGDTWAEIDGWRVLGLHHVQEGLKGIGYSIQPVLVPACGVDARHRRMRVWIVAYREGKRRRGGRLPIQPRVARASNADAEWGGKVVADAGGLQPRRGEQSTGHHEAGLRGQAGVEQARELFQGRCAESAEGPAQWLAEPELGRVAHGVPCRVDRLRGLGNAIVPQVAEEILRAIWQEIGRR